MNIFVATIRRELRVAFRNPADIVNPLVFFVIVITFFPLGVGPIQALLAQIAPGVIWVAALLATLLSVDLLFRSDFDDGSLEQMALGKQPLVLIVLGKVTCHWLVTGLPLTVLAPVLAGMLYVNQEGMTALVISLLLGTPVLSFLGAIGAALTVGLRKGGVLISILILPLYIPVLILGTAMVDAAVQGTAFTGHILWLGAILALAVSLAPIAASAGVRISLSQ